MTRPRMLVSYGMSSTHVQATLDYLHALKAYTGCDVEYLHCTHDANIVADFDRYDIVFQNYCARHCYENYLSESYRTKMRAFRGLKITSIQDEYDRTGTTRETLKDLGFDVVLTCVPPEALDYVFPHAEFPGVTFVKVLTGYVSDALAEAHPNVMPLTQRPVFLGYRARTLPARYGLLGFEKVEIGRRMKKICDERGIETDIAVDDASRLRGSDWLDFIGRCRAMLGSETASNVFDFDGSLDELEAQITQANGGRAPTYEEFAPFLEGREGNIRMEQVSPRVFECAVMRTPLVLFRGGYSGVVRPDEHYIPLEKDFSNADEVLRKLEDIPAVEAMAARTYEDVVASGRYSYRAFGEMLRGEIDRHLAAKARLRSEAPTPAVAAVAAANPRRAALIQVPTDEPKSHLEFTRQQQYLQNMLKLERCEWLEQHFDRSIDRRIAIARRAVAKLQHLSGRFADLSREARRTERLLQRLRRRQQAIGQDRMPVRKELVALDRALSEGSAMVDALAAGEWALAVQTAWIDRYSIAYAEFEGRYAQARNTLRRRLRAVLRFRLGKMGTGPYIAAGLCASLAELASASFLTVKNVIRRSQHARRLATALLQLPDRFRRAGTQSPGAGA